MKDNGYVYQLEYTTSAGEVIPFYVGATGNLAQRKRAHNSAKWRKNTDVYKFIRAIEAKQLKWDLVEVLKYEIYNSQEYTHMIMLVQQGVDLSNMKGGDLKTLERKRATNRRKKIKAKMKIEEIDMEQQEINQLAADFRKALTSSKLK